MIENIEAERAVIGAAILSENACAILGRLNGSDFTDTRHRVIAAVISDMIKRNQPVDQLTLVSELRNRGKLTTPGGAGGLMYVTGLTVNNRDARDISPVAAESYADELRKTTRVRLAHYAGKQLTGWMENEDAAGEFDSLLNRTRDALDKIPGPFVVEDDDDQDTVGTILAEPETPDEWLIPGLLSRDERVVFVAGEGIAKTTLLRQMAVCLAAGLNPWNGQRVADGLRVLFIDTENSRNQSRRAYRWIANRCYRPVMARGWQNRIIHKTRNDGMDLSGVDCQWFQDVADRVAPDVMILGSAYKMMRGDPQKDVDVMAVLSVIDKVRVAHRAAVLIETHATGGTGGVREMRPYGSSYWRRWPEIGVGYYRDETEGVVQYDKPRNLKMVEWRGAREPRDWPDYIEYGGPKEFPWVPARPDWAPSIDLGYEIGDGA